MVVHIDEPGRQHQSVALDRPRSVRRGAPTTDPHDAIAADAERPAERRRASSVDDQRVRDDEVEHRRSAAGEEHAERGAGDGRVAAQAVGNRDPAAQVPCGTASEPRV